ncbi:MAG: AmmeMemoRadiSam system protein A [Patescibacteria group bacterium]
MFSQTEKIYMLNLARQAIEYFLKSTVALEISESDLPSEKLKQNLSCFVTLTIMGKLRGCIGHLEAFQPLYKDIIENAVSAAFSDYRFKQLTAGELPNLDIEISVLSESVPLNFTSPQDLLNKLKPNVDGVVINKDGHNATFLPQVWEELPDKKEFLSSLCLKAGLNGDAWQEPGLEVSIYTVEVVK